MQRLIFCYQLLHSPFQLEYYIVFSIPLLFQESNLILKLIFHSLQLESLLFCLLMHALHLFEFRVAFGELLFEFIYLVG